MLIFIYQAKNVCYVLGALFCTYQPAPQHYKYLGNTYVIFMVCVDRLIIHRTISHQKEHVIVLYQYYCTIYFSPVEHKEMPAVRCSQFALNNELNYINIY